MCPSSELRIVYNWYIEIEMKLREKDVRLDRQMIDAKLDRCQIDRKIGVFYTWYNFNITYGKPGLEKDQHVSLILVVSTFLSFLNRWESSLWICTYTCISQTFRSYQTLPHSLCAKGGIRRVPGLSLGSGRSQPRLHGGPWPSQASDSCSVGWWWHFHLLRELSEG